MERERKEKALKTAIPLSLILLLSVGLFAFALPGPLSPDVTPWDFPRLDEIWMVRKFPASVALGAAKACDIDVFIGAIDGDHIEELRNPPYNWNVSMTEFGGFHMCYHGFNCRDTPPDTAGLYRWFYNRTTDFPLIPCNISSFRLALQYIVGITTKEDWLWDIYQYINRPQMFYIPPANEYWVNPYLTWYSKDWDKATDILLENGFTHDDRGTPADRTDDLWMMPNGKCLYDGTGTYPGGNGYSERYAGLDAGGNPMYGIFVACPGVGLAPTSHLISKLHMAEWNRFFMGVNATGKTDSTNTALFIDLPGGNNYIYWSPFYNRDHDIYMLCWGLGRNPDYLYDLFHPDVDYPGWGNSPGLVHEGFDRMLWTIKYWKFKDWDLLWYNMGDEDAKDVAACSYSKWVGPLATRVDETVVVERHNKTGVYDVPLTGGINYTQEWELRVGEWYTRIHIESTVTLYPGDTISIVFPKCTYHRLFYDLDVMRDMVWLVQWKFFYLNPYNPIYSRNYINLFKPGLTCWVDSEGYGSCPATTLMPWTFGSIHWCGQPVGGSMKWHVAGETKSINPILAAWDYEYMIINRLFDPLYAINPYTHEDMPWAACRWELIPWESEEPNVPNGMIIKVWLRNDLRWHDGQPVTAEDVCWNFDFINSTQAPELVGLWMDYVGSEVINDELVEIYVNATGMWKAYDFLGNALVFPKVIWEPFWGDYEGAIAFEPQDVDYEEWTGCPAPPDKPGLTCYIGTGPFWMDYWDYETGIGHLYKNRDYWVRAASGVELCTPNKYGQLGQLSIKGQQSKNVKLPPKQLDYYGRWVGEELIKGPDIDCEDVEWTFPPETIFDPIMTHWHETHPEYCRNYDIIDWIDREQPGELSRCDSIIIEDTATGEVYECHVDQVTVTMEVGKEPLDPKPEEPPEPPYTIDTKKLLFFEGDIQDFNPEEPVCTQWHVEYTFGPERTYQQKCVEYHLAAWEDTGEPYGVLSCSDHILLVNKEDPDLWAWYHVQALKTDLVVNCFPPEYVKIPKITRLKDIEVTFENLQKCTPCTFEYKVTCDDMVIAGPVLVEDLECYGTYHEQLDFAYPVLIYLKIDPCVHYWKLYCRKWYPEQGTDPHDPEDPGWSAWSLQYKKKAAYLIADGNADGDTDTLDQSEIIDRFLSYPGHKLWWVVYDFNQDLSIDTLEMAIYIDCFLWSCKC